MDRKELIESLNAKFYKVNDVQIHEGTTEAGVTVWGIGVFDKEGDVVKKLNLTFYTLGKETTSEAFWGGSEPKPTPLILPPSFSERVNTFIDTKIADDTIKFGFIEELLGVSSKALVSVIMPDNSTKQAIITEKSLNVFSIEVV